MNQTTDEQLEYELDLSDTDETLAKKKSVQSVLIGDGELKVTVTSKEKSTRKKTSSTDRSKQKKTKDGSEISAKDKSESEEKTGIEKTLWSTAKKYKELLDKEEVPPLQESENDREAVTDAYKEITTSRHRQLDARVYSSLATMQRTRDVKVALEGTTEKDRLQMIAWEVKIRMHPLIFLAGDTTVNMSIFGLHQASSDIKIIDGESEDLIVEDDIDVEQSVDILADLPARKLSKEEKAVLKQQVLESYQGREFSKESFEKEMDSITADLISLLVREKELVLVQKEGVIRILTKDACDDCYGEDELVSQSITLAPKKLAQKASKESFSKKKSSKRRKVRIQGDES